MDKRTAEIIMICKGNHDFGDFLNHKQAIAAYLSDRCLIPIEYYEDGRFVNEAIWNAALDYLDSIKDCRPSSFLRSVMNSYDLHNNSLMDKKYNVDMYEAVCGAFSVAQVRKASGEYINGFTEENTQYVYKKNI